MNVGMLWLDADQKRPFIEKVQRAVDYYAEKYGRLPELCLVNSKTIGAEQKVGNIVVKPVPTVLPNHFWLGVEQQQPQ